MANNESFIDEVNDEVRRERLYASLRRYGWIGIVVVLLIVGGASFNEYRKATARAEAEAFGDAVLTALETSAPSARATALKELDVEGNAARTAVLTLLAAGTADGEASEAELAQLDALAQNVELSSAYRDLAAFGSVMLQGDTLDPAERIAKLQPLAIPGSPYALLASEQIALAHAEQGNADLAIELLRNIIEDSGVTQDLSLRAAQVIVALGGTPEGA